MRASEAGLKKQTPAAKEDGDGGEIKQKNEGKWRFSLRDADDDGPLSSSSSSSQEQAYRGCVLLEVPLPRYLDSSLIDVDVHPTWVSLVVKAKLLRLKVTGGSIACSFALALIGEEAESGIWGVG